MASEAEVKSLYQEILKRGVDEGGLRHYVQYPLEFVRDDLMRSEERADLVVKESYRKVLGREPEPQGLADWKNWYIERVKKGDDPNRVIDDMYEGHRNSPEYAQKGGRGGEYVRQLVQAVSNNQPEALPPFVWGGEEEANARAYAEAAYGPYFADLVSKQVENAQIDRTRLNEDATSAMDSINRSLQDFLSGSDIDRTRLNDDYDRARNEEARRLGVDLETLDIQRTRGGEDKDRTLAELQVDFNLRGGQLSDDKVRELTRLTLDKAKETGRLTEDEQTLLGSIERQYGRRLDDVQKMLEEQGQIYGGERVRQERMLGEDRAAAEGQVQTAIGRQREDVLEGSKRRAEDIEREASRRLEELDIAYSRSTEGTQRSFERNLADLNREEQVRREENQAKLEGLAIEQGRNLEDIQRNQDIKSREAQIAQTEMERNRQRGLQDIERGLEQKQKDIEREKQRAIELDPLAGIGPQRERAEEEHSDRFAENERSRLDPSQFLGGLI